MTELKSLLWLVVLAPFAGCAGDTERQVPAPGSGLYFPCEVDKALSVCRQCHTTPQAKGAPFPLLVFDDVLPSYGGSPIHERMKVALENGEMPLPPATISDEDKATLLAWLSSGAAGTSSPVSTCK